MEKVEGKDLLKKYVKNVKEKKREPAHVGGALAKKSDPIDNFRGINKLGMDMRDY